jgi:hypothetical protein
MTMRNAIYILRTLSSQPHPTACIVCIDEAVSIRPLIFYFIFFKTKGNRHCRHTNTVGWKYSM